MDANHRRIIWSPDAKGDIQEIFEYLASRESVDFAAKTIIAIGATADRLSYQALLWRVRDTIYPGARFVLVESYVIVYDVRDVVVNIARILHGVQDIEAIFQTEDDPRL